MNRTLQLQQRQEIVNAITHGFGVLLAIGGGAVLITLAVLYAGPREIVTSAVFVASLVLLYSASTLYHSARGEALRSRLKVLDHCAIFLLIAGTYTPFTIAAIGGGRGWSLFGVIWGMAIAGIAFKLFFTGRFKVFSTIIYIGMGWLAVVAFVPLTEALTPAALGWLIAGGLFYTVGTLFYHREAMPYSHAVWHLFVLGGSVCHFVAVTLQLLGLAPVGFSRS
ncbi:MAG: hemolysin III family protein [Wenzhouxiangellaceae bacterium]|nr:hemolysin III family protein [Wenzhouxiangellaceae bacterium]